MRDSQHQGTLFFIGEVCSSRTSDKGDVLALQRPVQAVEIYIGFGVLHGQEVRINLKTPSMKITRAMDGSPGCRENEPRALERMRRVHQALVTEIIQHI